MPTIPALVGQMLEERPGQVTPTFQNRQPLQTGPGRKDKLPGVKIGMNQGNIAGQASDGPTVEQLGERTPFLNRTWGRRKTKC